MPQMGLVRADKCKRSRVIILDLWEVLLELLT